MEFYLSISYIPHLWQPRIAAPLLTMVHDPPQLLTDLFQSRIGYPFPERSLLHLLDGLCFSSHRVQVHHQQGYLVDQISLKVIETAAPPQHLKLHSSYQ